MKVMYWRVLVEPKRPKELTAGGIVLPESVRDAAEQLTRCRVLLEGHQIAIELIEVLVALDQELRDDLVEVLRRKPVTGPDTADAIRRQHVTGFE